MSSPPAFAATQGLLNGVPLSIARFEKDMILLLTMGSVMLRPVGREAIFEQGGYFAAWEKPDALVLELRVMFGWEVLLRACRSYERLSSVK